MCMASIEILDHGSCAQRGVIFVKYNSSRPEIKNQETKSRDLSRYAWSRVEPDADDVDVSSFRCVNGSCRVTPDCTRNVLCPSAPGMTKSRVQGCVTRHSTASSVSGS